MLILKACNILVRKYKTLSSRGRNRFEMTSLKVKVYFENKFKQPVEKKLFFSSKKVNSGFTVFLFFCCFVSYIVKGKKVESIVPF